MERGYDEPPIHRTARQVVIAALFGAISAELALLVLRRTTGRLRAANAMSIDVRYDEQPRE